MLTRQIYAHAGRTPDKTALVFNGREVSYFRFASLIEVYRRLLEQQGLAGGGLALLSIDSYLHAWIAGLALRGLGLTTLVLPSPDDAVKLGLPAIRCVVTFAGQDQPDLRRLCKDRGWRLVELRVPRRLEAWRRDSLQMPDWPTAPGGRILLTSGTTGTFKMTLFDPLGEETEPHRRLVFGIADGSVVLVPYFGGWSSAGYNVPAHVWDAGGTVAIYQGSKPWESFRRPGISHAFVTPHLLAEILRAPAGELPRNDGMHLIATGGALLPDLYEAATVRLTNQVFVCVGATEAGVYTETRVNRPEDLRWHRIVPGCEVQIVDDEGKPLPDGQIGEVRVRVADGATGYLNDETASREFFSDGYFYPGDLGMLRSDGRLALRGRKTDVLNLLGEKVAPAPLEERLASHCGIPGACIFEGRPEDDGHTVHVVLESSPSISQSKVGDALTKVLPAPFKAKVYYVGALPRNHMGKVRREALKQAIGLQ